jgi:hypothetical protein
VREDAGVGEVSQLLFNEVLEDVCIDGHTAF